MKSSPATGLLVACAALATACAQEQPALKTAFKENFLVGAALVPAQFYESNVVEAAIVKAQFNSITPENVMKWEHIHPHPAQYDFGPADRYVEFGQKNGMFIIGHTLIWHSQTPAWVFEENGRPASREVQLQRMREHITTVVGRYKGRVKGWDVVNEALNADGSLRKSPWMKNIGEDYLVKAYQFAHEADPEAELYYNDFSLEDAPKREGAMRLVKKLQAAGVKLHGIGTQQHMKLERPTLAQVDDTLTAFGQLGVKVMVTELDIDVLPARGWDRGADVSLRWAADPALNPYTNGLPAEVQQALTKRYADLFAVYRKHSGTLDRVTFWGVTDRNSWLNDWPIYGRTSYPLLFDRAGKAKPAFDAVVKTSQVKPPIKLSQGEPALGR
ncbi:MAG: endo-1,4-beta-xylanase [Verrucomicrobia bacterium]|nr:MAG: endo-1,4-beta-xylanase [Verrucomicrobiota bacterium]